MLRILQSFFLASQISPGSLAWPRPLLPPALSINILHLAPDSSLGLCTSVPSPLRRSRTTSSPLPLARPDQDPSASVCPPPAHFAARCFSHTISPEASHTGTRHWSPPPTPASGPGLIQSPIWAQPIFLRGCEVHVPTAMSVRECAELSSGGGCGPRFFSPIPDQAPSCPSSKPHQIKRPGGRNALSTEGFY